MTSLPPADERLGPRGSSSWDRIADAVLAVLWVITVPAQWGVRV